MFENQEDLEVLLLETEWSVFLINKITNDGRDEKVGALKSIKEKISLLIK